MGGWGPTKKTRSRSSLKVGAVVKRLVEEKQYPVFKLAKNPLKKGEQHGQT